MATNNRNTQNNRNSNNKSQDKSNSKGFGKPVALADTGLEVTDMRVYPASNAGKLLATAAITLNGCLVLKKLKVIEGKKGPFVAMPSEMYEVDGEKKYTDIFFLLEAEARTKLEELIVMEYETL